MSNNMPRQSREKSGTGIYQMIIRTVPLIVVNAKNNKASDKFVLKYADIDCDKKITQSDIDAVVKIIMQK